MRAVRRDPIPSVLDGPDSPGGKETQRAIDFHQNAANAGKSFGKRYKAYGHAEVKAALRKSFGRKCGYCESPYAHVSPVDVEHYRPKGEIHTKTKKIKPGYYWLAADWDNLLPSCIDCNRSREQELADGQVAPSGKANLFPVADERKRATKPGQEAREDPLLLDPCRDDPEQHLEFGEEGIVLAVERPDGTASPKGVATIETVGLQRVDLVHARRDRQIIVRAQIQALADAGELLKLDPDNPRRIARYRAAAAELKRLTDDDAPYTAMVRREIASAEP